MSVPPATPVPPVEVMIDLETLGTSPGSAILSIGAVKFQGFEIIDKFYVRIDLQSCFNAGLKADGATILWWLKQSEEARREFTGTTQYLNEALVNFKVWYGPASLPTWGNGANFDNALIGAAFRAAGLDIPWNFWGDKCYRTLKGSSLVKAPKREGTYHHALDDAIFQTEHLFAIRREMQNQESGYLQLIHENEQLRTILAEGHNEYAWQDGPEGWDDYWRRVRSLLPEPNNENQTELNLG